MSQGFTHGACAWPAHFKCSSYVCVSHERVHSHKSQMLTIMKVPHSPKRHSNKRLIPHHPTPQPTPLSAHNLLTPLSIPSLCAQQGAGLLTLPRHEIRSDSCLCSILLSPPLASALFFWVASFFYHGKRDRQPRRTTALSCSPGLLASLPASSCDHIVREKNMSSRSLCITTDI